MRIESKGIIISEIFDGSSPDTIEISADGGFVTLVLEDADGELRQIDYTAVAFRKLLDAMQAADAEIRKIENRGNGEPA